MPLSKKPVNGMKDILPAEMSLRNRLLGIIRDVYSGYGFSQIETPVAEHLSNLQSKSGGDNEKLIFKILKRGERLKINEAETEDDLADSGLRYDLTVPLVRYYANNCANLPKPFKALQIGPVFRADRPQKGRYRQFYQCDIDIIGEASKTAEIELIAAAAQVLCRMGLGGFIVRINDRRILRDMARAAGLGAEDVDRAFVILDKIDKIGLEGVRGELEEAGFPKDAAQALTGLCGGARAAKDPFLYVKERLSGITDEKILSDLESICTLAKSAAGVEFDIVFDPSLVRGMGYYTGTIFEIEIEGLACSAGGGGRYDGLIGKFTGKDVPACGFSLGFERLITIISDRGETTEQGRGCAWLVEKDMPDDRLATIFEKASAERAAGKAVFIAEMAKNRKHQKELLSKAGFGEFMEFWKEPLRDSG